MRGVNAFLIALDSMSRFMLLRIGFHMRGVNVCGVDVASDRVSLSHFMVFNLFFECVVVDRMPAHCRSWNCASAMIAFDCFFCLKVCLRMGLRCVCVWWLSVKWHRGFSLLKFSIGLFFFHLANLIAIVHVGCRLRGADVLVFMKFSIVFFVCFSMNLLNLDIYWFVMFCFVILGESINCHTFVYSFSMISNDDDDDDVDFLQPVKKLNIL